MPRIFRWESSGSDRHVICRRWAEEAAEGRVTLASYPAGSWGPPAADRLLAADGRAWRLP